MARRHTPYYHKLVALGAEMADRIGFDAAVRFTTTADEHKATRERVGIYDVYYQGVVDVKGPDAEDIPRRPRRQRRRRADGRPGPLHLGAERGRAAWSTI